MLLLRKMVLKRKLGTGHTSVERIVDVDRTREIVRTITIERSIEQADKTLTIERVAIATTKAWSYETLVADINAKRAEVLATDPYAPRWLPTDPYYAQHQALRDTNWAIIKDIVEVDGQLNPALFDSDQFPKLVNSAVRKGGPSRSTVYRLVTAYLQRGMHKDACFPHYHRSGKSETPRNVTKKLGAPSIYNEPGDDGVNITTVDRTKFELGIKRFWLARGSEKQKSLPTVYQKIIEHFYHVGYDFKPGLGSSDGVWVPKLPPQTEYPQFSAFEAWYTKHRARLVEEYRRHGRHNFETNARTLLGKEMPMALGPGSIIMLDATVADVFLVSRFDRTIIIGRPIVYVAIDVYSWLIVGIVVLLEGPSYVGAMTLMANIAADKVTYCRTYEGMSLPPAEQIAMWWPWHFIPYSVLVDRGEMRSENADRFVDGLSITVTNTAPWRPDWKGMIERTFRLLNDMVIHHAPGTPYSLEGRIGSDYIYDAQLTVDEFTALIILALLDHNRNFVIQEYSLTPEMVATRVSPTPLELFEYGITHHSGVLAHEDPDQLRLRLLPKGKATISRDGLKFKGLLYWSTQLHAEGKFARIPGMRPHTSYEVLYEPRLVDAIYLRHPDMTLERCELRQHLAHYRGLSFREVAELRIELGRRERVKQSARRESTGEFHVRQGQLLKDSTRRTNEALQETRDNILTRIRRLPSKRFGRRQGDRAKERNFLRNREAFTVSPPSQASTVPPTPNAAIAAEAEKIAALRNQELNRLRIRGEE